MAEEKIVINIDEFGKISAATEGFQGETCLNELEKILEGIDSIVDIKKTDKYYQKVNVKKKTNIQSKRK